MIVLYTIDCPKCIQLEKKLQAYGITYTVNKNIEEMKALGITSCPYMSVDGKLMNFSESWKWIKENYQNECKH